MHHGEGVTSPIHTTQEQVLAAICSSPRRYSGLRRLETTSSVLIQQALDIQRLHNFIRWISHGLSFNMCKDFNICSCNREYAHCKHI